MENKKFTINILSRRELECLKLMAQGRTAKVIGTILHISPRTVETYIKNIKRKSGLTYKSDIIEFWHRINHVVRK